MTQGQAVRAQIRGRDERGASLMFVLMLILIGGIVMVALAAYASTSSRVTANFNEVRAERYAADGAVKGAINWIRDQPQLAIDPDYDPNYDPSAPNNGCIFESQDVTVTCETPAAGSGSGVPPEQGSLPPETVLLLGARHNEPGPYSFSQCDSLWDAAVNFVTGDTLGVPETSFLAQKSMRSQGFGILSCTSRDRGNEAIKIRGNVVAAGKIQANDSFAVDAVGMDGGPGTIRARYGCVNVSCNAWVNTRSAPGMPWDGTPADSDPGRISGSVSPIGDIRDEFLPIGFNSDGTVRDGYSFPERTQAYVYDATANVDGTMPNVPKFLRAIPNCSEAPAGAPIIFLPGWYKRSEVLSQYTAAVNSCLDRTFWFPPNAGPDNELLTADDETGAYYMDFKGKGANDGRACGTIAKPSPMTTAAAARWCLGGSGNSSYNTKPRVVVGWPLNWEPFPASGTAAPGSPAYGTPVPVNLPTANNVAGNWLSYWSETSKAKTINGEYATYAPCQFWIFTCPTLGQRTLRLENFAPKVTGAPLAESGTPAAPKGRLRVQVAYGLAHGSALGTPYLDIDVLDPDGVAVDCGSYAMVNDATVDFNGSGPLPDGMGYTFTDEQAKDLADRCGSVEMINNMRLTLRVGGNILNDPLSKLFLDGARIYYNSYQGASFPVGEDNVYNSTERAKSDCDVTKPGAQLIFGGEAHVVIADGSLEVCGGPDPDNPANAQVIGIYGVPAVEPLRPASNPTLVATYGGSAATGVDSPAGARRIGEPAERNYATVSYPGECWGAGIFIVEVVYCGPRDGGARALKFDMEPFEAPEGYKVSRIAARASYTASGGHLFRLGSDGSSLKAGACNEPARATNSGPFADVTRIRQWANEGLTSDTTLTLFADGTSRSCISPTGANSLASGASLYWQPDVPGGISLTGFQSPCTVILVIPCNYTQVDRVEGLELDVTIEPSVSSEARLRPQSGCIVAHPNYTGGEGTPDCALVRADAFDPDDSSEGVLVRGSWVGRVSVKGMIYAPSAAMEIDDDDIAYPLATRGVILRHLRISGAKARSGYTDPWFGGEIDTDPAARQAVLTACTQTAAVRATPLANRLPCGENPGDVIQAKAGVRFLTPETAGQNQANAPVVQWWSDRLTTGSA